MVTVLPKMVRLERMSDYRGVTVCYTVVMLIWVLSLYSFNQIIPWSATHERKMGPLCVRTYVFTPVGLSLVQSGSSWLPCGPFRCG